MQGSIVRKGNSWNIGFANPVFDTGSITSPTPTITNGTTMTINAPLNYPGDKYAFTVDLKNTGNVPALIQTLNITQLTAEQQNYLRWKVEYEDESTPSVGDLLKAGETKKLHIYLEYKKLRAKDLYPLSSINLTLTISVNFYLPEETYNTVTLTKNGSTKTIQVSNLEQEVTLTDFPVESTDQIIACNNGVEPSTNANNKIVLKKVKQNAICRIENSLADAITNSTTEVSNLVFLNNSSSTTAATISNNQNITIDLNGKTYTLNNSSGNNISITNNGVLIITDKKSDGLLSSSNTLIENNAMLYIRKASVKSSIGSTLILQTSETIINNSNILSNTGTCIKVVGNPSSVIIRNSNIEVYNGLALCTGSETIKTTINIYDSQIKNFNNTNGVINLYGVEGNNIKMYSCNNSYISNTAESDINDIKVGTIYFYYYNNVFLRENLSPYVRYNYRANAMKTSLACAE